MELNLINFLLVLLIAAIGGALAQRLGYASLMGEMVAGMLFGPMLLGWVHESEALRLLAEIGVFMMMLYIGIEVDHRDLMKASWAGVLAAVGGFVVPFVAGFWLVTYIYGYSVTSGLFIGLAMGVTSLATKSRALIELKLLGTRVANVMLAGALACDTLALIVFAGIVGFAEASSPDVAGVLMVPLKTLLFFSVAIWIGLRIFPVIGRLMRKFGFTERSTNFTLVVSVGLLFAELAELAGLHAIIGAFIAGLFIREEVLKRKVSHEVAGMVHDVSLGFLAPVFFVTAGFKVNIAVLWTDTAFLGVIIFVALVTKVLGTWLFYLPTRNGWREGLVIGLGMNGRGAVEIIIAEIGLQMGLINQTMFSVLVFMAFFTTALEPVFLKAGAHWLRKRRLLVRGDDQRKLTLIAGASPLARQLARDLAGGEQVCLLDSNANLIQAATMEGLNAMKGNVLNEDFFDVAGAAQAETLIAMTANQEVNRIAATQARNIFGVPEAWTWPVEAPLTTGPHPEAGEILTVSLTAWNEWITRKEVEAVRFSMIRALPVSTFQALVSVLQLMPLVVEREGRRYPAMTIDGLLRGDEVYGLRRLSVAGDQADLFEELMSACPVMDMAGPTTAEEVFRIAGEKLSPLAGVSAAEISGKLMAREKENTTVIAPGLAIPHITLGGDQPVSLLLVRTRDGATYLDPGQRPVQTTLVIAGSRETRSLHLRIISAIAQLYQRPGFEDMLLAARDTEAIRQVVLNMRRRL